jgi:hypothetical protein
MDLKHQKVELNLGAITLNTEQAAQVAGEDVRGIDRRLTRGDISIGGENPGRGRSRAFTPLQVAQIKLTKMLLDTGATLSAAAKISESLRKFWESTPGSFESDIEGKLSRWLVVAPLEAWKRALLPEAESYVPLSEAGRRALAKRQSQPRANSWADLVSPVENLGVVLLMHNAASPNAPRQRDAALSAIGDSPVVLLNVDVFLKKVLDDIRTLIQSR